MRRQRQNHLAVLVQSVCRPHCDVDTSLPLRADDPSGFYEKLLPLSVIGCYNAFAAATAVGCERERQRCQCASDAGISDG